MHLYVQNIVYIIAIHLFYSTGPRQQILQPRNCWSHSFLPMERHFGDTKEYSKNMDKQVNKLLFKHA